MASYPENSETMLRTSQGTGLNMTDLLIFITIWVYIAIAAYILVSIHRAIKRFHDICDEFELELTDNGNR